MGCFFPLGGSQLVRLAPVACVTITVQVAVFAAEFVAFVCDFGAVAPLMVIPSTPVSRLRRFPVTIIQLQAKAPF